MSFAALIHRALVGWVVGGAIASASPYVPGFASSSSGGDVLYSELGCANCHGPVLQFPRRGPNLLGVAQRLRLEWVRAFLANPEGSRPGSNMPAMFSGPEDPRIEPVLHFLMSRPAAAKPGKQKPLGKDVNAEQGSEKFHTLGCVACHQPSPDFQPPGGRPDSKEFTHESVAFPALAAKYSLESLTRFLENPTAIRPDSRMPDLGLAPAEALDIAAHLVDFQESNPQNAPGLARFVPDPAKVAQGAAIYETLRCAACHEPDASSVPVPIRNRQGGCLALSRRDGVPFYDLSAAQRTALQMEQPFSAPHPIEVLNCLACHSRDGNGGPDAARSRYFTGDEALGDSGRLPPPLTGIGRKLRPEWMEGVFAGKNRIRPYVNTRMPVYAAWAKPLTTAFSPAETAPLLALAPNPDPSAGRKLLGVQGGVNCITCHQWGVRPSLGIQALDISTLGKRLRPEWFRQYLLDPASYRPGTLMPPLWPGGQSMIRDVLEGDTERQIASIWAFILKGDGIPEGFPDIVSGAFELIPKDRPIVQRAFLNGVGPQAILTGFPGGVNLAYNGETGRPAKMWRGRFFDAYSTWFLRAAPFEDPLGTDVLDWPGGSSSANQFLGYRLEKDGSPVFLNNVTGVPIEEHFEAVDGKLRRTLIWKPAGEEPVWTHPGGAVVTEAPESGPGHRIFFYHWKP